MVTKFNLSNLDTEVQNLYLNAVCHYKRSQENWSMQF